LPPFSHPDAGKTTLTEKLLLFGGTIQLAGKVTARGERGGGPAGAGCRSKGGHGISVSEAMMSFEHGTRLQSARQPGPPGFQRGRLSRASRGRQPVMVLDATKAPGGKPESSRRSAGYAACRSSPLSTSSTRKAVTHRPAGRDRAVSGTRRDAGLLADRHGARFSRHL